MNEKDIKLFAKMFVCGTESLITEQTSRDPISLSDSKSHNSDGLFERHNIVECSLKDIENDLIDKLTLFTQTVQQIREGDKAFSKKQLAEEKRQAQVVKKLKQTIKK